MKTLYSVRTSALYLALAGLFGLLLVGACSASTPEKPLIVGDYVLEAGHPSLASWKISEPPAQPADNMLNQNRVELGRALFFETALSSNHDRSCASCHEPAQMWSDGLPTALDLDNKPLPRATPSLINVAFAKPIMWDGRSPNLEHQAMLPLLNEREMGGDVELVLERLNASDFYTKAFAEAYATNQINSDFVSRALAAFQRTLISDDTDFDRWVAGDATAMSPSAVKGFAVFLDFEKGRCAVCHDAPYFTDNSFHNIGLPAVAGVELDIGRYAVKPINAMRGAFKTPQLREISSTAPYFHDGSSATLPDVIDHYVSGFEKGPHLSVEMKQLNLTPEEKADLTEFLSTLNSSEATREKLLVASSDTLRSANISKKENK